MNNLEFNAVMKDLKNAIKQQKLSHAQKQFEYNQWVKNHSTFTLFIQYKNKQESGLYYDEIMLEGWDNAITIYEAYKKIGINLNLHIITLRCVNEDNTKVKSCNFKYN